MEKPQKQGVLLVNLGTPRSTRFLDVYRYLGEFLFDRRVISLPFPLRFFLVFFLILPLRTRFSMQNYKKIWDKNTGSPLLHYTQECTEKLAQVLGENFAVACAMRYQEPRLDKVIDALLAQDEGIERLIIVPLYPQNASATTGSTLEKVFDVLKKRTYIPPVTTLGAFYNHSSFIRAFSLTAQKQLSSFRPDFILFSYHGLPESHIKAASQGGCLENAACCLEIENRNSNCYRAQCFATSRLIAQSLALGEQSFATSFQSRLGKTPWIAPSTESMLSALRSQGVKRLVLCCPSFVADCLETLEEVDIKMRADWESLGGEAFHLVSSLNAQGEWVEALAEIIREKP